MPSQAAFGKSDMDAVNHAVYPRSFKYAPQPDSTRAHDDDPCLCRLVEFFQAKGLVALKEEDRNEQWYDDWLAYQTKHKLYASILSPREFSTRGNQFDLLRLTRFAEAFAYYSPAHGYSFQVTFLGLAAILMGSNASLKHEAILALEAGGLFALGVSEKNHGADLLSNEFAVREVGPQELRADGGKYYIGNANCASIIAVLARQVDSHSTERKRRDPIILFALRPHKPGALQSLRKIRTLGVRAAYVGEFEVQNHRFPASDIIGEGRRAWDAVFGAVTLGKFVLGFGSIGICERALEETVAHLHGRMLYGQSALAMPHIQMVVSQAYARLTAMKLYADRALDYVHSANAADRRYLLFCAVQKAKVSTEGVKVVAQLSECMGAKGFESDTYFESALRDIQLIPGLEGSTHINLGQIVQFIPRYFAQADSKLADPPSMSADQATRVENAYLFNARSSGVNDIAFAHCLGAYKTLVHVPNVRIFIKQVRAIRFLMLRRGLNVKSAFSDKRIAMAAGQCVATITYAQLIAENARRRNIDSSTIAVIFHLLVGDLYAAVQAMCSLPAPELQGETVARLLARRIFAIPRTTESDWDSVAARVANFTVA